MRTTHLQRLATEFRVPLFEGFTMPSSNVDSETAAMFKQLLLRPLSVPQSDDPEDVRVVQAFAPLCSTNGLSGGKSEAAAKAFTWNWMQYAETQTALAQTARAIFLDRYEWPSVGDPGGAGRAPRDVARIM